MTVTKSGKPGAYWVQQFNNDIIFPQFCLMPTQAASVAVTFPSGRQYRFAPQASPQCVNGSANTAPEIVWVSTSDPNNPTITLAVTGTTAFGGSEVFAVDVGNGITQLQDGSANIWDPRKFTLTIEDGSTWLLDQDKGVTQVTDLNGNSIKITPGGILHSSGTQVTFARDAQNRITAITDPDGNAMSYAYTPSGDLASFTDRASQVTQFAYDGDHYLTQIQDPLGRLPVRNDYDASGRLLSTTDASGNAVHYAANLAANQEQVTDRLGHVTAYTYDQSGDITQKVDATGAVWNYTVDLRGNVLTRTDPLGHTTTTTYDGADDPLTVTDPLGHVTTNTYNRIRELVTSTDPLGHVTSNQYDGATGNLIATTDGQGNTTQYRYDLQGNRLSQTDALGETTLYQYDDAGRVLQQTDANNHVTTHAYDANGNKLQDQMTRTNFNGSGGAVTTGYAYDAMGRLLQTSTSAPGAVGTSRSTTYTATGKRATSTDGDGRVTRYTYDALDRLITTTQPDGTTLTQTYDAENHRISSTDAAGNTTQYAYDPVGRLVRTTYADGSSTSTTYDPAGRAIQTADELGHVTWTAYDAAGRRTSTTNAVGALTQYAYDAAGNQASMTDPLGHTTSYAYDADNRVVATTYADGSADSTDYDTAGRVIARTDTLGRSTHYGYDKVGQLVKVTDALGHVTKYTYDEAGAKTTQLDANLNTTSFLYDWSTNVMTERILPDGAAQSFGVDAAAQITRRTDYAGRRTNYSYDALGRVLTRSYPDGSSVSFTYTPTGQRATATDARGTTTYAYDSRNRLVLLTYPDGRALSYGYDAHGDRTSLTAKVGSTVLTTTTGYDAADRPSTVTDPLGRVFNVSYDTDDAPTLLQYPNGTQTTYAYDLRHRVTSIDATDPATSTTIASFSYTLDSEGERMQVVEAGGTTRQYGYDSVARLTSESVTGSLAYAKAFTYDAVGNRLTQTTTGSGAGSVTYAYDSRDRLTTENSTVYSYDANGNLTAKAGEATYGWDFENRLTSVPLAVGTNVTHQYDPDGNRVQTVVTPSGGSAAVDNLLVDPGCATCGGGLSQAVVESDGSGNVIVYYARLEGQLLAEMRPAGTPGTWTTRFIHDDGLGSVRALTDETGTTIDTQGYEAFGAKNVEAGSAPLAYGFAGEPFQQDSMLAYHRARWMDARVGRFLGMDS